MPDVLNLSIGHAMPAPRPEGGQAGIARSGDAGGRPGVGAASPGVAPGPDGLADRRRHLHQQLLAAMRPDVTERLSEPELRSELGRLADELARQAHGSLDRDGRESLVDEIVEEVRGYGPIGGLMRANDVSEILINGPRQVYVERRGQLQITDVAFRDEDHLLQVVRRMVAGTGRRLDRTSPLMDARLPDGSRLNAVLKPPALNGPLVSIRRFGARPLTVQDLLANDSLAEEMLVFLAACVKARVNVVISGGTGSGKTTLLNALSRFIAGSERLVTIEDTAELELQQSHVAKIESQPPDGDGQGGVTMRDLVRNALRMRPDRIIVGECRGGEALEMLQAMNTGHEGSMTTVHANSSRESLTRIELMISLAGVEIPVWAIRRLIAASINLVVQVSRLPDGKRKVVAISEVTGVEGDVILMHDVFAFVQTGADPDRGVEGHFQATGIRPQLLNKLSIRGAGLPHELFVGRRLPSSRSREAAR